ncbi:Farnesyl diphosphate synthase (plasmid) [Streptomyces sp. YIM 121038]|uniref:polyprenyl synthetase family protein n=1 Tax=Streptomyces sp. YIM 121038 TaxID=2136401 RepID=UPI001110E8F0|nr:polyprenyl synthetase family protein [Streptomyces sp. YIM 121038]QCX82870.1 Farnesyl diphosphate synthase [Streptomyces sp. YIM 121038]
MGLLPSPTERVDLDGVPAQVDAVLDDFLSVKSKAATNNRMPAEVTEVLHDFLFAGGKRLRPVLCVAGWHAADGGGDLLPVVRVAASLEMFHAFCLIHDDVMDHSDVRRGQPTLHRALAHHHMDGRGGAAAEILGEGAAILVGDLALAWSDELLHTAGLTPGQAGRIMPLIAAMRAEVMYGQYLDLTATGRPTADLDQVLRIARYKAARYTVERPLHIGAALAGADTALLAVLSKFALPVGEAFQLRDDLLGIFGDPLRTGKPHLDDLREGKATALMALALRSAGPAQRSLLSRMVGDPHLKEADAARIRGILISSGARDEVERMIRQRLEAAELALAEASLPAAVAVLLRQLGQDATARAS